MREVRSKTGRFLTAALVFSVIFGVAMTLVAVYMPTDRLLARFNPNGTYNESFIEWEDLQKQWWTSLDQVSYENGNVAGTARFVKTFGGEYTVTHTDTSGNQTVLNGSIGQNGEQAERLVDPSASFGENLLKTGERDWHRTGSFIYDKAGNVTDVELQNDYRVFIAPASDTYYTAWQTLYHAEELIARRTYPNTQTALSRIVPTVAEDRDANETLLRRTKYTYEGRTRTAMVYDAAGDLLSSTETQYDLFGRILRAKTYNPSGELTSEEHYHYRFWERLYSPYGFLVGLVTVSIAFTIAFYIYDDRFKFGKGGKAS